MCSVYEDTRTWLEVAQCDAAVAAKGGSVWIRARLSTVRAKGKTAFVVLRKGLSSVQAVVADGAYGWDKEGIKWLGKVTAESIVDVYGDVMRVEQPTHTSQSEVEVKVRRLFVVSLASPHLPFQLIDAARPASEQSHGGSGASQQPAADQAAAASGEAEAKDGDSSDAAAAASAPSEFGGSGLVVDNEGVITVGQDLRLDNRWIDLRTPANHAIFRLQSRVCQYYRQFFLERDFIEIHTPKLTPGVSEGGAAVFRLKYFEQDACLAQSPQLYKQMAVASDLRRVFEIGPVFRAEYSNSQQTTHTDTHSTLDTLQQAHAASTFPPLRPTRSTAAELHAAPSNLTPLTHTCAAAACTVLYCTVLYCVLLLSLSSPPHVRVHRLGFRDGGEAALPRGAGRAGRPARIRVRPAQRQLQGGTGHSGAAVSVQAAAI